MSIRKNLLQAIQKETKKMGQDELRRMPYKHQWRAETETRDLTNDVLTGRSARDRAFRTYFIAPAAGAAAALTGLSVYENNKKKRK